jgi:cellulose synthase/poly-beta-1,6-N-acetylglucosamine synthase-like glycosyltransferase
MTLSMAAQFIFWTSAAALFYTYAGYPLLLSLAAALRSRPVRRADWTPRVTVIISAYNEELDLERKLENTLELDYPPELLEVIVSSDCSTDRTDQIAGGFASRGVQLHRQPERLGKTAGQNAAVERATADHFVSDDDSLQRERKQPFQLPQIRQWAVPAGFLRRSGVYY